MDSRGHTNQLADQGEKSTEGKLGNPIQRVGAQAIFQNASARAVSLGNRSEGNEAGVRLRKETKQYRYDAGRSQPL
jgi:hypothetical protein